MDHHTATTMLFVEDDDAILNLLRRLSTRLPCTSLFASDAEAALVLCAHTRVDIVVSDFSMPGMTGIALLSTIAEQWPQTLRVLITGHPRAFFEQSALERVVDLLLFKPWHPSELRTELIALIERAQAGVTR